MTKSALYPGTVSHHRLRPKVHRLRYRVAPMLLDLDELPALARRLRLFAHNRAGIFSFHERDHGDRTGHLRAWVHERLKEVGLSGAGSRIAVLCYPRMLGYVFNPLSVFFCFSRDGALGAVLYEVHNTLGERHTYVIPANGGPVIQQSAAKKFYVSPFVPMECTYRFKVSPPAEAVAVSIAESDADGMLLWAHFAGSRRPLTDGALLRILARFPLMTLKVIAAIHYEAVKLWLKGVPIFPYRASAKGNGAASDVGAGAVQ